MFYFGGAICTGHGCWPFYPLIFWYLTIGYFLLVLSVILFWSKFKKHKTSKKLFVSTALLIVAGIALIFLPHIYQKYQELQDEKKAARLMFQTYNPTITPNWAVLKSSTIEPYDGGQYVYQQRYYSTDGGFLFSQYSNDNFVGSEKECRASNPQWDVLPKEFLTVFKCELLTSVNGHNIYVLKEGSYGTTKYTPLHYFMVIGKTRISIKQSQQQSQILSTDEAVSFLSSLRPNPQNKIKVLRQRVLEANTGTSTYGGYSGFPN